MDVRYIYILYNYCLYIAYVSYVYAALNGVVVVNESFLADVAHCIFILLMYHLHMHVIYIIYLVFL